MKQFQSLLSQGISLLFCRRCGEKEIQCKWFQSLLSQGISLLDSVTGGQAGRAEVPVSIPS